MSTSGQGDQNMEIDKDNESEITSTTSDNGGAPQNCATDIKTLSEAVADANTKGHVESSYEGSSLGAVNDDVEDSAIDSVTTESKNDKDKPHIDDAEVVCGKSSSPILPGRDIEVISLKECQIECSSLEAVNDDVETDSAIDSYVTTESKNDKDKPLIDDAEVVCGKISPHIPPGRDIEVTSQQERPDDDDVVTDSAVDSYVTTESKKDKDKPLIDDAEVVCDKISPHIPPSRDIDVISQRDCPEDDGVITDSAIDSSVTTESKKDKDKALIDDAEVVCGKISPTIPPGRDIEVISQRECPNDEPDFSKNTSDKDSCSLSEDLELKWDEDDIDEAVLTDDVKKNQDIENDESDKSTIDETAQLIQKLDLVIDESKNDIDDDKIEKIESNQSSDQIIKDQSSGVDNIKQKVETLSGNDKDDISLSIEDNKIDDIEMTSTSFDSQDIIDEIDNITEDDKIGDMIASCIEELDVLVDTEAPKCEEPNVLVHTETPNEEMDIETISADQLSKNVESIAEIKLQSPKQEEKMDIEIEAETPIESVELSIDEKDNTEKCEIAEREIHILKEKDTKEVSLVDTTDNLTIEKSDVCAKDVEIKESLPNESANLNEDKSEIPSEPNVSLSTEVSSVDDSKTEDSQTKDAETIEAKDSQTNENDCENESVPIEDSIGDSDIAGTITPNIHHRINKPNVMLDIPTQELSDIEAELDDDDLDYADSVDKTLDDKKVDNSLKTDIIDTEMTELNDDKIVSENVSDETVTVTSPTIVIDATSSILNIKTFSISEELKSSQEIPSTSKSDEIKSNPDEITSKSDAITSKSIEITPKLDEITSKSIEITSKSDEITSKTDEITSKLDEITSKSEQSIDNEITTPKAEETNEDITSNTTQEISENLLKEKIIEDPKLAEANVDDKNMHIDEQPSTSKPEATLESPDTDDLHELSDSLGLLAESSRVMDDDDDGEDAEDQEVDENDDEDFDPYDETNSEIAEDMEDSNTPPPELFPKLHKPGDKLSARESDDETMEVQETTMDIVDDIECDENDLELELPDDTISEIQLDEVNKNQPEIIDADMHKEEDKTCPPEKIINILEKVLGPQISTGVKAKNSSGKVNVKNYVEVEGSSDSDDVQEVSKTLELESVSQKEAGSSSVAVPKTPTKVSKINTDEVTIKTASTSTTTPLHIPETTIDSKPTTKPDEIFNLDSDDDEAVKKETTKEEVTEDMKVPKEESPKTEKKCINPSCNSGIRTYYPVDRTTAAYYSLTRRTALVCEPCRRRADERSEALINGIKDLRPLLELDMDAPSQQLVEISDSDSDGEGGACDTDGIGEKGATFLEEHLADMINETWNKYKMESRLKDTEMYLLSELDKIEANAKEINDMLDECQRKTDAIRVDFYKDYELRRKNVGAIVIHDTPFSSYSHVEKDVETPPVETFGSRYPKRRAASMANDTPAKRPAIPMGYTPLDGDKMMDSGESRADDDKEDISVVKLSAESAPADLPPPGEIVRPPLKVGMTIYAMRNAFGTWLKGKIMDVQPKASGQQFSQCRVKFEHKVKNPCKVLAGRCLAYPEPSAVRMTIGTRVVALFKDPQNPARRESFYGGVIAEIPNPVNSYRYLVFFDDGYAQYVHHQDTRIVCESSNLVWEEVHQFIRDFIYKYLLSYPERPMVRLHAGEKLKTEWNGKWWDSKVLKVDASIALISFDEDNRTEWIYRGSTRLAPLYLELQAARAGEGKGRSRLPRNKAHMRSNMPCVEYTRSDEQPTTRATAESQQQNEEMRRQRAVAKKSTTQMLPPTLTPGTNYEGVISRVVYYTPKNAVKPYKMSPHTCSVNCRRSDLLSMKDLRTYNPLAKPLLSGWERQTVRYKGNREVVYRAPCGRRLRNMFELHKYLRILQSDMSVDLFDFTPGTHCLAEFVLSKCNVSKKDLSHGKENVPVPCVNYYDTSLPEFCSYNTERTPTAGVPLNIDPEFLCGCDCTDDCIDKTKCACWKMTLEGARTVGLEGMNVGYVYRRLPEPLPSGIYECNSRCKCKQTCLNRVAQHPLQLKLQVFKTINRGWGIRALNDVPKGSFLCVYAGNLLTDATANLDGLNEGDEYLAELDYIEVVEAMKEGYEDDIPEKDKKLDKKGSSSASESEPSSESEEEQDHTKRDGDFQPGFLGFTNPIFKKSLRKREKAKKKEEEKQKEEANKQKKDDCITISDDEEVREPSRFTAEAGMVDKDLISKHSSRVSVRTLFGKDEACYIMDAKVQGNIGRYLNHSCHPNVFVQNVFVDTHDPRFPWVAFFALSHVRAGTELTWNYNYDVGSVPEKVLYCYCGAANCRGRLL